MLDTFASATDMENRSQGEISTATHPFLDVELRAATRAIRNAAGWHIADSQPDLVYRRIQRWPWLCYLPAMRITSLQSVYVNGIAIDPTLVEFDEDTGQTNLYGRAIEVTYTAGFETVPEDLQVLTLEIAAGALGTSLGIIRETAGSTSVTMARSGGGISLADLDRLAEYRIGPLP